MLNDPPRGIFFTLRKLWPPNCSLEVYVTWMGVTFQMRTNGLSWESVSAIAVTLIATVAISALAAATLQSP